MYDFSRKIEENDKTIKMKKAREKEVEEGFHRFGDGEPLRAFKAKKGLEREVERSKKELDDFAQKERPDSVVDPLFVIVMALDPDVNPNKKEKEEDSDNLEKVEKAKKDLENFAPQKVDPLFVGIRLTEPVTVMVLDPDTNPKNEKGRDKVERGGLENEASSSVLTGRLDQILAKLEEEEKHGETKD